MSRRITKLEALRWEAESRWWISCIGGRWLQNLVACWLARKVNRKYAEYERSEARRRFVKLLP